MNAENIQLLKVKEKQLKEFLSKPQNLAVAFSGGVDSSLLLAMALKCRAPGTTFALTCATPLISDWEIKEAHELCLKMGVEHLILQLDPLEIPQIKANDPKRCYYCKKFLFTKMLAKTKIWPGCQLAEASHADDTGTYRPGLLALAELRIWQPLLEYAFTKQNIRDLAQIIGLPNAQKPANPCFATRFPYNNELTKAKLQQVEQAEKYLAELGFSPLRLRSHDQIARIEVAATQNELAVQKQSEIVKALKNLGFRYVCLDLAGFHSGSMDQQIK